MLSNQQGDKILAAFQMGSLKVRSVSPEGDVEWKPVLNVIKNEVPWERIVAITNELGTMVLTGGHPVYIGVGPGDSVKAEALKPGDLVLSILGESVVYLPITAVQDLPPRQFMYDITVDSWHRFQCLSTRNILSNSPDKFYHFAPPEAEGNIGAYNQVFGQIWRDDELFLYLERGLDWWNMMPPMTEGLDTIDKLVLEKPAWRTAILWEAITHACFALATMWVHEEFSYSIGGISLDLERSSKYESLKQNAESQFDKAAEAKTRTVKFLRGISQPKYGIGIRSSFGSAVGRGVLSPRNFL